MSERTEERKQVVRCGGKSFLHVVVPRPRLQSLIAADPSFLTTTIKIELLLFPELLVTSCTEILLLHFAMAVKPELEEIIFTS